MEWTKEQKQAIETKNCKLLVAAGAGSGKTAVLVQRIIDKVIKDKIDIDRLLIVTFTNAAASEMRERIADALYKKVNEFPELNKQILLLNRASIMTIDSFCNKVIKDNFFSIDLDPNFKVADMTENELLKIEALDEVIEELYDKDEEMIELYSTNKSDENFRSLITRIHSFIQSSPYPENWLHEKCEMYHIESELDFGKTVWGKELIKLARMEIAGCIEELEDLADSLMENSEATNYLLTIQDDILQLKALRLNNSLWDDFYEDISKIKFTTLKRAPKLDIETAEEVKSIRNKVKDKIQKNLRDEIFISSSEEILRDVNILYQRLKKISEIVLLFDKKFKEKKHDKNLIDFSDMEHLCLELLSNNEAVRNMYKNQYEEILIDEYQDSNLIQETILNLISRGNMFMVGDVKQSIYKFRQARPELFLEKYHTYPLVDNDELHDQENIVNAKKILLFKNFRSNKNIIDECNFIFKNTMSKEVGDITYDESEYLKFGAEYYPIDGENAEIHLIEKSNETIDKLESSSPLVAPVDTDTVAANSVRHEGDSIEDEIEDDIEEKPQLEARVVSRRIEELVGSFDVYDKKTGKMRKAKYGDIVILLRATKGYADYFVTELSTRNIPVFADVNSGYFENMEVQVMLALLKVIDNPYQDIPLVAVLRSKIGDFDANELTDIRLVDKNCSFYEAMQKAAGQGNIKVLNFLNQLSKWREQSKYLRLGEFIWNLYEETNYYDYISVMPNGSIRKANLDAFLEKAERYDNSSYKGLFNFINFIDNLRETTGDMSSNKSIGDSEDVVRVMSIHKSKGLEFPIVFLCGTARKFNQRDERNPIIMHQDFGFGADIINLDTRITYESIPKLSLKQKIKEEALSEEIRILYVALTRAREKLIITCLANNLDKKIDAWSINQTPYVVANGKCFADWICGTVFSHENDWKVYKWSYSDVLKLNSDVDCESYKMLVENIANNFKMTDEYHEIDKGFKWKYPYHFSTKLPSKITVTELKRLGDELSDEDVMNRINDFIPSPNYMQDETAGGAKFGTLLHNVMQRINFETMNIEQVVETVEEKYRKKVKYYLENFMHTNLYKEIKSSKKVYREMPFNLALTQGEIYGETILDESSTDEVLIQGVIDLYFETNTGIVLVDYKTDHLNSEEEFINRYRVQLDYYKRALETLTKKKVEKVVIYAFYLNKEIVL
ncbi:MAG: helicase-exonuclease AddAB subunit AddA [Clostridia bacterium]|nr:helicase-exonuclease AddAB subunit AddA [Clostridia bacterium]